MLEAYRGKQNEIMLIMETRMGHSFGLDVWRPTEHVNTAGPRRVLLLFLVKVALRGLIATNVQHIPPPL